MKLTNPLKKETQKIRTVVPTVNIHETDKEVILEAEMVGLNKDNIRVSLSGNELIVRGTRNDCNAPKGYTTLHQERCPLAYERTFVLSDEVDKEKVKAQYERGILTLRIAKSEKLVPKQIKISE